MAKLQPKTRELFELVKANGGRMSTADIADKLGVAMNSVTGRVQSLVKNELAYRDKVEVEGAEKPVTFVQLTDAGMSYDPDAAEEE